jgi:hypothetical protein
MKEDVNWVRSSGQLCGCTGEFGRSVQIAVTATDAVLFQGFGHITPFHANPTLPEEFFCAGKNPDSKGNEVPIGS